MKVGFIGLGIMGKPMAKNLLKAGHQVCVNDFHKEAVEELVAAGATAGANNANCFVIFVTSHQELVYDSFNFRPLNFICKDPDADVMKDRLHMVAGQLTDALKQEKTVVLENREQGRISVKLRDVTYIESNSHSIIYHFANNKDTIAVRDSIGEIEEAYRKFDFIRVHKKYIVNLKYVFNVSRSNETVIFKSGSELPMSRGYKNAVDDALTEYLRRK